MDSALEEQIKVAFGTFQEAIQPVVDAFIEFTRAIWDAFTKLCRNFTNWVVPLYIELRRHQLFERLVAWRLPRFLAAWLANHWPVRWLPDLALAPPIF